MSQRGKRMTGFTLLESLVAFTLLALILSGAFQVSDGALRAANRANDQLLALQQAQSLLSGPLPEAGTEIDLSDGTWTRRLRSEVDTSHPGLVRLEAAVGPARNPVILVTLRPAR